MILHTPRLRLEPYQESHFEGLLTLNSDPRVMRFLGGLNTEASIRAQIWSAQRLWVEHGTSWWAFIDQQKEQVIGAGCIQPIEENESNSLEVGWRLQPECWGRGLATEAGHAMLRFAFSRLQALEVYAVADPKNHASLRVMQRLGMQSVGLWPVYGTLCATYVKKRD